MRTTTIAAATAGLALALLGCDSPGGGGTTAPPTDTTQAQEVLDAGDCNHGDRRCSGQTAQQCISGSWSSLFDCPSTQTCVEGTCRSGTPNCTCAGKVCGDDGCGNTCGSCTGNTECQAGQCVASGSCSQGSVRCSGQTPQQCVGGSWSSLTTCGAGRSCIDGGCVDDPSCTCGGAECGLDSCGTALCGSCFGGESCVGGQCVTNPVCDCGSAVCGVDNCGNSCGSCLGSEACSDGQCVPLVSSGDSCTDILDCVIDGCLDIVEDDPFYACQDECIARGTALSQQQFEAYATCLNTCSGDDFCFAASCPPAQAACFFESAGFGTCIDILDCMDFCATGDGPCFTSCYEASTRAAQEALLGLNACLDAACPDATSGDDPCYEDAFNGTCATYLVQCQTN